MASKILVLIPARGGSKGVPRKNIIDLGGKPLIQYSIDHGKKLLELGFVSRVVVSTDCLEIAEVAERCGGEVPFLRPANISNDKSKSTEYVEHALGFFENSGLFFDAVMILQPTCPYRSETLLANAVKTFNENDGDSLITVYKDDYLCDEVVYFKARGAKLKARTEFHNKGKRRQQNESMYVRSGSVYITKLKYFRKTGNLISDDPLYCKTNVFESINIDTFEDLCLARGVYEYWYSRA